MNAHTEELVLDPAATPHAHTAVARISLLEREQVTPEIAAVYDKLLNERGVVPNMFKALAQVPALALGIAAFLKPLMGPGHLTSAYKELVATRVALLNGCDYCISSHRFLASLAGASQQQIEGLADFEEGPFSSTEKSGFRYADALHTSSHAIDDAHYSDVIQHFNEPQLLELTAVAAAFEFFPRLVSALALPVTPLPGSAAAFLRQNHLS